MRESIAAGAPIEAADLNRKTPTMLAAESGHGEAFHALVEAFAYLHALALCDIDLLESAATGGNVEIIKPV